MSIASPPQPTQTFLKNNSKTLIGTRALHGYTVRKFVRNEYHILPFFTTYIVTHPIGRSYS